jgi:HPt (histidine-containing phosphotransfer) domain-containing protein
VTDLLEKFLPRFLETAGRRVARVESELATPEPSPAVVLHEMHAVAGEAGLIGLPELAHLAREGEKTVRRGWDEDAQTRVKQLVDELQQKLGALAAGELP